MPATSGGVLGGAWGRRGPWGKRRASEHRMGFIEVTMACPRWFTNCDKRIPARVLARILQGRTRRTHVGIMWMHECKQIHLRTCSWDRIPGEARL